MTYLFFLFLPALFQQVTTALLARAGRTSPPSGAIVVTKSPQSGQFSTLQTAVNSISTGTTAPVSIFIYPGTYNEQVYIPKLAAPLAIYGYTTDTSTYASNVVTITQKLSQDDVSSNDLTATIRAWTPNLKIFNVKIANTRGKGSQAVALSAQADRQGFYACKLTGYQDTLLANQGKQVYAGTYIEGATDFVFGQRAAAWFARTPIRVLSASTGWVTANGRDSDSNPSYYVFDRADITAANGQSVAKGAYYLGRPWRNYSRVVFQNTKISDAIDAAGWSVWSSSDPKSDHVTYAEYGNSGDGAKGTRVSFSKKLSVAVKIEDVLGNDYKSWVDMSYM